MHNLEDPPPATVIQTLCLWTIIYLMALSPFVSDPTALIAIEWLTVSAIVVMLLVAMVR